MEKYMQQFIEIVQVYFDRRGIEETAKVEFNVPGANRLQIEIHTKDLLPFDDLAFIEKITFALLPIGLMYELVNMVTADPIKVMTEGDFIKNMRELPNIDTSADVTMPVSKKNKGK